MVQFSLSSLRSRVNAVKRAALLGILARQTPQKLMAASLRRLPGVVDRAMRKSVAWRTLLEEAGIGAVARTEPESLIQRLPVVEKSDLFERFSVAQLLATDIPVGNLAGVLTSSGHGGRSFAFGLASRRQAKSAPAAIDVALQQAFDIDGQPTLLLNCLPMGVMFTSDTVCVANVSVREDMALAILRQAGPLFGQVILCVDPLFCKRFLDYSTAEGFDWNLLKIHVILGEETFAEEFRTFLAECLGVAIDSETDTEEAVVIGSSMGVGELGLNLFFETSETIAMRRVLHRLDPDRVLPSFFCFNPLRTLVEVHQPDEAGVGDLVVTVLDPDVPIPMIRYRTGDRARWLADSDTDLLPSSLRASIQKLPMPIIAMLGRDRERISEHWHVDHFKALLYRDAGIARCLSGAFRISGMGSLRWEVQLSRTCDVSPETIAAGLAALAEASARERQVAAPEVLCFPFDTFPYGMNLDYERKFRYYPGS